MRRAQRYRHLWSHPLVWPFYAAAASILIFAVHGIVVFAKQRLHPTPDYTPPVPQEPIAGVWREVKANIRERGGWEVFFWKLVRLLACIALAALSIVSLVSDAQSEPASDPAGFRKPKHKHPKVPDPRTSFTQHELVELSLVAFYVRDLPLAPGPID